MCQCDTDAPARGHFMRESFCTGWDVHSEYKDKGGTLFVENGEGIKTLFLFNANNKGADQPVQHLWYSQHGKYNIYSC